MFLLAGLEGGRKMTQKNMENNVICIRTRNTLEKGYSPKPLRKRTWIWGAGLLLGIVFAFLLASSTLSAEDLGSNDADFTYKLVTVQEGDSLWQLVQQSGLDINTNYLIEQTLIYNNLKGTYLTAGQMIYIPWEE
jgi:hypothetical protein